MIKTTLKRSLSMILALVMVFAMVPASVFTAFADPVDDPTTANVGDTYAVKGNTAKPDSPIDGADWMNPVKSPDATCGKIEHTHTDDCYDKVITSDSCTHGDKHTTDCYSDEVECSGRMQTGTNFLGLPTYGECDKHTYHWTEGVLLEGTYKSYGANTRSCPHVHTPYGQEGSCYVNGDLGEGCPTREWTWDGLSSRYTYYEHTHSEPGCYTYTWTLTWKTYDVNVTITGNDNVKVVDGTKPATATHGTDVTFKLSATGDASNTWTALIGDKSFTLSATEETEVTAYGITSGEITVELTSAPVPTYDVTLSQNTLAGCSAVFEGDHEDLLPGAEVVVEVTLPGDTNSAKYSYTVEVTGTTDYVQNGNEVTVKLAEADAEVKITYVVTQLVKNESIGNVKFNPAKSADEQLEALQKAIFTAVVNSGASLPEGIEWDDIDYKYYPWTNLTVLGTSLGTVNDDEYIEAADLNAAATSWNIYVASGTTYAFGGYWIQNNNGVTLNGDCTERVLLSGKEGTNWAGLSIEATIKLVEGRTKATINYTKPTTRLEFESEAEIKAAILAAASTNSSHVHITRVTENLPSGGAEATLTYKISVAEDSDYLANEIEVTIDVKAKANPATINITVEGNGTVNVGGLTASGTLTADTYSIIATPTGSAGYVASVTINNGENIAENIELYENYVFKGSDLLNIENGLTYNIKVRFDERTIDTSAGNKEIKINKYQAGTASANALSGLKDKVLTAAGLDVNGNYTVTTSIGFQEWILTLEISNDGVTLVVDDWLASIIDGALSLAGGPNGVFALALYNDTSRTFTITQPADNKYPAVSATVTTAVLDSRETPTYTVGKNNFTVNADTVIDETWLKNNLGINVPSDQFYSLTIVGETPTLVAGNTYTVTVKIVIVANDDYKGLTEEFDITIVVNDAFVKITGSNNITYNPEMSVEDITKYILENLTVLYNPLALKDMPRSIKYLANEATTVPVTINLKNLDLGGYSSLIPSQYEVITVDIPVAALWLDIGAAYPETTAPDNAKLEAIFGKLINDYGPDLLLGRVDFETLKAEFKAILDADEDLKLYYQYLAAHKFGAQSNETIKIIVDGDEYGEVTSNTYVIDLTDTRTATEIKLNSGVTVTYGKYTEAELMALILDGVYANGTKIDGLEVVFVTDVIGLPASDEGIEITVKFKGNANYKPSTATTTIVINRAPASVSVDNRLIKWYDGLTYAMPVITDPADLDTIKFIVGLDISDVNVDPSEGASVSAIKGILGNVQLMLPAELQSMLSALDGVVADRLGINVSFADGASMKLSELQAAVSILKDFIDRTEVGAEYAEYFDVLFRMLESLPTDVADIEVTIGGELPTNVGAYLVGAVTADSNYETSFGVGVVVIYPDGIKADIAWNQNDDNYIITNTLLSSGAFDTGAHATAVGEGGNLDDATAQIIELFVGVDVDANIIIETDPSKLNVGAYVEVAMVANWGNQMYYSAPLARPIVVVAETLDVDFVDASGSVNNERWFEFDNTAKNGMEGKLLVTYKKDGDGYKAGDVVALPYSVKYLYVGVQSNGMPYASTTAPVHAGAYTVTAIVVVRDGENITHAGQGIGALVIEASKSEINVENEAVKWEDGKETTINQFVDANSVNVPTITPDTTIISAGISADLDANIGLAAIKGNVNIDMPAWLDNVMNKLGILEAGYADGIKAETFISYVEKLEAAIAELGVEVDAFNEIVNVIKQLPGKTTLTFHDNKGYTDVGVYLIIGIVTDSDHYPSADAGIMVIYPDGEKVELQYNETWDGNNVFTQAYLKNYDLNAQAYYKGAFSQDLTDRAINLFVGFADHGELILTQNKEELDNGVYAEVSFLLVADNVMYYAEPIAREVIILPNNADIDFTDSNGSVNNERLFGFDNQSHSMDTIRVTLVDGTVLDLKLGDNGVAIYYLGIQANGMPYASYDAPTHAGVYEVTAQYTERDAQDRVIHLGVGVGILVIEPSKSTITVENEAVKWDGKEHSVTDYIDVSSTNVPTLTPDTTIISAGISADLDANIGLEAINGNVNIDMPAWLDNIMNKLGILEAGYADGIKAETFISYVEKLEAAIAELGVEVDAFNEIVNVIKQLPGKTILTFHDNKGYSEIGVYLIIGIVTDSDHYPSAAAGIMVIYPDATKVELSFNKTWDDNNVFTWEYLKTYDLNATASVEAATSKITNIYVGFTDDGKILLKSIPNGVDLKNEADFDNGIYTQVSYILDLSNEPYYAEPISRVFVVVPNPAKIEFIDEKGNVNADRHFVFDNTQHAMAVRVTLNGVEVINPDVTITYVGVQTNGQPYNSTTAPVHAGTYVVTATYTVSEQGRLVTLGAAVGAMVIEPAKAEIDVDNRAEKYEQGKKQDTSSMVVVTADIANITPDKTVITAMIKTNGTFSENGLKALEGAVNMDLPAWLDAVVAEYDLFTNGLTAAEFIAGVNQVKAKLAELGITTEALDGLVKIASQLPADATITFKDQAEIAPEAVGAYLVIGVVTDSDFYPAMDAGILVIYPAVTETNLSWIYEDVNNNNIYTKDTLEIIDLGAKADADADIADLIVNLFIGVDAENWQIAVEFDQSKLNAGVYEEFSFVKPNVDSVIYYATPVNRPVIVVANIYNVNINNVVTEMFDNTAKDIGEITVTTMSGEPVDISNGTLEVVYIGIDTLGRPYYNAEAPVHAGIYTVVVTYVGTDADGDPAVGASIAKLTITPADVEIEVGSHAGLYGQDYEFEVKTTHNAINDEPKTIVIIAGLDMSAYPTEGKLGIDGTVNVDFPEVIDNILEELFPELYVNGIGTDAFFAKYDEMVAAIEAAGYSADHLKQLKTMLEKLNAVNLTFNETAKPTETGLYAVIAMTCDPNYEIAVDTALIAIAANATVADLDFNAAIPGALNILPYELLKDFDFGAHVEALLSTNDSLKVEDIVVNDVIFGLTADLELFLGSSSSKPTEMGIYDQIAYAETTENNLIAVLPIVRLFTVEDHSANVVYIDPNGYVNWLREFEYDGQPKDMGASIIDANGNVLTATPNLWYIGIEDGCVFYSSSEAPTEVGYYSVIGYYMDSSENIYTVGLGAMRIKDAATKKLWGDVNSDGEVTTFDAVLLLQYIAELVDETELDLSVADVSDESGYTTFDAVLICQYVAEIIEKFPVEE